jgi:Ca2+-binding EF-hand superfamily protein
MLKKVFALLVVSSFSLSNLTACGTSDNTLLLDNSQLQVVDNQNLQANSFSGVMKEVKNASELAFKELDKNGDKNITPDEYGVATPDAAKAFYALDKNHDGKISKSEFSPNFLNRLGLTFRLRSAASSLFKQLDKNKDKLVSKEELNSGLVSSQFLDAFDKYDKQKKTLFHKDAKNMLSLSEFENLFAYIAVNNLGNQAPAQPVPSEPTQPAPVPAEPTQPAPAVR